MTHDTKWLHNIEYPNGAIRVGYNRKPDEDRPFDIIRLLLKTEDGEGDADLNLTIGEAADICAGLSRVMADRLDALSRGELVPLDEDKPGP